jgi:hypothetical protein
MSLSSFANIKALISLNKWYYKMFMDTRKHFLENNNPVYLALLPMEEMR